MAAKLNASGAFNAYFLQQPGQGGPAAQHQEPAVSDLHLKMSKKIAQLTKVVYALNSKNDESESLIAGLKSQFEEEKEQLFLETSKKMEEFKVQVYTMSDSTRTISELEARLREFQGQKAKASADFESFRCQAAQAEARASREHERELQEMTKALEGLRGEQEAQSRRFEETHERAVREMIGKHREEVRALPSLGVEASGDCQRLAKWPKTSAYKLRLC